MLMELDFHKYHLVDRSPTTVLPSTHGHSKAENRESSEKPKYGDQVPTLHEDFAEVNFSHYRGASNRNVQSRRFDQEVNEVLKRGSVYQNSKEVRLLQTIDDVVGREKIEFSGGTPPAYSLGIIDLLCISDEDSSLVEQKRPSLMPLSEQSTASDYKMLTEMRCQDSMTPSESDTDPVNEAKNPRERDLAVKLHESLPANLALPHSPAKSESESSRSGSPKRRFSPVRKMLDPFVKFKTRSPLSSSNETGCEMTSGLAGMNQNKTICKSLLNDVSDRTRHVEYNYQCEEKESHKLVLQCSPAHLHALLKLRNEHGMPFFQFSVKSPEDVYVAKAWKVENSLNWVYTFHSFHRRGKNNASGRGVKDSCRELSMVGQMVLSCHVCTEFNGAGELNDCMVTEFVLYDIIHSRKSTSSQDSSICAPPVVKAPLASNEITSRVYSQLDESCQTKAKAQSKYLHDGGHFESSASKPLSAADLHPELEIVAIVVQVPLEKRESLKIKSGDENIDEALPDLTELGKAKKGISDATSPGKMHVVIPAGNHSLPIAEGCGPSRLLDRWRLGGGCDCSGWDMACPLSVLSNPNVQIAEGQTLMENQNPAELFVQGRKDDIPAFTMRVTDDGNYAVDFHAQLSSLQAFSICIAILHAAQTSTAIGQQRSKHVSQSELSRVFSEDEIKYVKDSMAEEVKSKVNKKMEGVLPSFVLNPPFSPIARV